MYYYLGHYGFTPLVMFVIAFCAVTPGISYVIITVTRRKVLVTHGTLGKKNGHMPNGLSSFCTLATGLIMYIKTTITLLFNCVSNHVITDNSQTTEIVPWNV